MVSRTDSTALNLEFDTSNPPKISSWKDIETLPNYTELVDEKQVQIIDLLCSYDLHPMKKCSLSGCGTWHGDGVIAITETGLLLKMGHDCGEKRFPEKFKSLKRSLKTRENVRDIREQLAKKQETSVDLLASVEAVLFDNVGEYCAGEWYRKIHVLLNRHMESRTSDRLKLRAKQGRPIVEREKWIEDKDVYDRDKELRSMAGDYSNRELEILHMIKGLTAVKKYSKLHPNKLSILHLKAKDFASINVTHLSQDKLKEWNKWVSGVEQNLFEIQEVIEECQRFCAEDNVAKIRELKMFL